MSGVICKINCKNCDKVYIGQTSRALRSRTREHKRAIFTGDKNSLLTQHCVENNHDFDLGDVMVIDRCPQWGKRLFLEARHSIREPNSINEHVHIPAIYKALGQSQVTFLRLFKHSFCIRKPFYAEEGHSILTETSFFLFSQ